MAARDVLNGFDGTVLTLFADSPLVGVETLQRMLDTRRGPDDPAVVVMGFRPRDTAEYGRLIVDGEGRLDRIVEHRDASEAERAVDLCNSGFMAIDGTVLPALLDSIDNDNPKGEYYLTDIVAAARAMQRACAVVEGSEVEAMGINSRAQLAQAEAVLQNRMRLAAMDAGVTLSDPASVWFSHDTVLGRDVSIGPNVFFGPGVSVGDSVVIHPFSHLEGCHVADGARIGPFARLRPEAEIGEDVHIGNFVEVKKARVEKGAKVNHLTYIGDARVGAGANVGAGTITCNYDGFFKHFTDIGAGAFIGSNTALVAPVTVGDGAIVGAGSTISGDVDADALALTRAPQTEKAGFAAAFREKKAAEKERLKRNS
jgi:bifunctional UDP-N-acetylglucosamine pyrophosphorylase/glucosamine-1-phosphate N-acetyltransferase